MSRHKPCRLAIYSAGAHTRWLEKITADAGPAAPEVRAVIDDTPPAQATFWGLLPMKPEDLDPTSVDAVFISTDRPIHAKLAEKCRQIWQNRLPVIDPYEGFMAGPYHKDNFQP